MITGLSHASRLPHRHDEVLADQIVKIRWHVNLCGLCGRHKRTVYRSNQVVHATGNSNDAHQQPESNSLVWLKHDLRLDDHPGFMQAADSAGLVVPFFCLVPTLYVHLLRTPNGIDGLRGSLADVRQSLRGMGSDLVIRMSPLKDAFQDITQQCNITEIITEEEVEHRWLAATSEVSSSVPAGIQWRFWKASLFEDEPYTDNFREFQRLRGRPIPPHRAPARLPGLPSGVPAGDLPSAEELHERLAQADAATLHPEVLQAARGLVEQWPPSGAPVLAHQLARGGERVVLPALHSYLRCRQPAAKQATPEQASSSGRMCEVVDQFETPAMPLGSFPAIFSQALSLGALSRRRVYHEALQLMAASTPLSRLIGGNAAVPARAAMTAAETADFHWHLARADRERRAKGGGAPRHWRWRGHMVDYISRVPVEEGAREQTEAPALLLVHGFGAFGEQWRGQLAPLAAAGYQVYAPTLPGFGRSEKPALAYSQTLWLDFLREFVTEVVRQPVIVVGNSIGGFLAASLAAASPAIVKGLVLVNSAGKIDPSFSPESAAQVAGANGASGPPALVADLFSRGLFTYLERSIAKTLVKLYPVDASNADEWLAEEIFRAACDPGALAVFRSVFYLPKPLPLNHLVRDLYRGRALVLQGAKDPLNDARGRAAALQESCPNISVHLLDAGHCPHDEAPSEFNKALLGFIEEVTGTKADCGVAVAAIAA
ncbi:probable pheophytinase, chloroplastic at C-terminar half [Coccomyxa sp. Obi]|nr:probable pheophytinase, chloroplastic at C-terminar half [Coccomyxa sp. Obi]